MGKSNTDLSEIKLHLEELLDLKKRIEEEITALNSLVIKLKKIESTSKDYEWDEAKELKRQRFNVRYSKEAIESLKTEFNDLEKKIIKKVITEGIKIKIEIPDDNSKYLIRIVGPSNNEKMKLQIFNGEEQIHESPDVKTDQTFKFLNPDDDSIEAFDL